MATAQIAVRVAEDRLALLDELVGRGVYESRAAAVRAGVDALLDAHRQQQISRAIVDGYRSHPPTDAERLAAEASLREAIAEEPW